MHSKVKSRIVIIHSGDETVHADFGVKFLPDLALESLLKGFTRFSLAPRELPPVLEFAVTPLGDENLSFGIADDRCYYCDSFHNGRKDKQSNCISTVMSFLESIGVSNYLTGPEGFEKVGHVVEVHITAAAADTVPGHNDLLGVRMLLRELRYSLLVIVVNMLL